VLVLETGRVFGGDSQYYYLGGFSATDDEIKGDAQITHYQGPVSTAFGDNAQTFKVSLQGKRSGDTIDGFMWRPEAPAMRIPVKLVRRALLP
jgi:hypothetical protein